MSRHVSPGKLTGEERKTVLQEVQRQAHAAAKAAVRPGLKAFLEEEVTAKLGRETRSARQISLQPREIDWHCAQCGCTAATQLTRDGQHRRSLETGWGHLDDGQVPMLACQCCQHAVVAHCAIWEHEQRFWVEWDPDVLLGRGLCERLPHVSHRWSATLGGSVGLRTRHERITRSDPLLQPARREPSSEVPAVGPCDGIWLTIQRQSQPIQVDRRQRARQQRSGNRVVV